MPHGRLITADQHNGENQRSSIVERAIVSARCRAVRSRGAVCVLCACSGARELGTCCAMSHACIELVVPARLVLWRPWRCAGVVSPHRSYLPYFPSLPLDALDAGVGISAA